MQELTQWAQANAEAVQAVDVKADTESSPGCRYKSSPAMGSRKLM